MKLYNYANYGNDIYFTRKDVNTICQSGHNDEAVALVLKRPYIKKQVAKLSPEQLAKELKEWGTWTDNQLKCHTENINRWVWVSAWNIYDSID